MISSFEIRNFKRKCLNPFFLLSYFIFLIKKFIYRIKSKNPKLFFYPYKLQKLCSFKQPSIIYNFEFINLLNGEITIPGEKIKFKNDDLWDYNFKDQEKYFSIHRFNWLLTDYINDSCRGNKLIRSWLYNKINNKNGLHMYPYTVGERISNMCLFYLYNSETLLNAECNKVLEEDIKSVITDMAIYLSNNLEYKGGGRTGNHIINNSRALLFAGVFTSNARLINIATYILKNELPDLINDKGFLREGSSHYQFVFTRWLLEIALLYDLTLNIKMSEYLKFYIKKSLQSCCYFIVYNKDFNEIDIPLIGDISPDFKVQWLIFLPWSKYALSFYRPSYLLEKETSISGWPLLIDVIFDKIKK